MSRSHDELLRPVHHESCCQRLPRRITKIRPSECLKFHTSIAPHRATGCTHVCTSHGSAAVSCVSSTYLIVEPRNGCNGCRVDDSNLLSMPLKFGGPGHLLASRTRMIPDRVRASGRGSAREKDFDWLRLIACIPRAGCGCERERYRNVRHTCIAASRIFSVYICISINIM